MERSFLLKNCLLSYSYNTKTRFAVYVVERNCEVNAASEISSFILTVCVKSVSRYHFKLAYVVLQVPVKEFFETHF